MRDFFEGVTWPRHDGKLHLYVLPDRSPALESFITARDRLTGIEHLPLMPVPYLHCTLQSLRHFDDEVTQADLTRLGGLLVEATVGLAAFDLEFNRPELRETAVECPAAPSPAWDELVAAVRGAVGSALGGDLPDPPYGPHLSLAYATGAADDALVRERLADVGPLGTMRVDRFHLVSVTVRPELGIFDFTTLADWDLHEG